MGWHNFLGIIIFSVLTKLTESLAPESISYNYTITKTWDGHTPLDPVQIFVSYSIHPDPDGNPSLRILVDAPYYKDPPIPSSAPLSKPLRGLWEMEVVEPYFLGEKDEYLEIELAPTGHYILFYLSGYRRDTNRTEAMTLKHYSARIHEDQGRWIGEAYIPGSYFPCRINKFNLFAIHKSGEDRRYMALYPVKDGEIAKPDFHYLPAFQPTPFGEGVEINPNCGKGKKGKGMKGMGNDSSTMYKESSGLLFALAVFLFGVVWI